MLQQQKAKNPENIIDVLAKSMYKMVIGKSQDLATIATLTKIDFGLLRQVMACLQKQKLGTPEILHARDFQYRTEMPRVGEHDEEYISAQLFVWGYRVIIPYRAMLNIKKYEHQKEVIETSIRRCAQEHMELAPYISAIAHTIDHDFALLQCINKSKMVGICLTACWILPTVLVPDVLVDIPETTEEFEAREQEDR